MKDYLLKGYTINNRMNRLEDNFESLKNKVNEMGLQISSNLIPNQGVFFDGQVIKNATKGRSPKIFVARLNNNLRRGVALKS